MSYDPSSTTSHGDATQSSSTFAPPVVNVNIMIISLIVLVMAVLTVAATHLYVRWVRGNSGIHYWESAWGWRTDMQLPPDNAAVGLEKEVVRALPTFVYRKTEGDGSAMECSVCISEFQDNETCRLLPKCNHSFHIACIDMWFQSHSTCPLCRATVGDEEASILHQKPENQLIPGDGNQNTAFEEHPSTQGSNNLRVDLSSAMAAGTAETKSCQSNPNDLLQAEESHASQSMRYPVNTLFYGTHNHVLSHTVAPAESFKKFHHLVIDIPGIPWDYEARHGARTTPPTPTSSQDLYFRSTPLSHFQAIKRMLSMGHLSTAATISKSMTDLGQSATLTP